MTLPSYSCRVSSVDDGGRLTIPGHWLIDGARVLWRSDQHQGIYFVDNFPQDSHTLRLVSESIICVTAIEQTGLDIVRVIASVAHGLENTVSWDDSEVKNVSLQNFGALSGTYVHAMPISSHDLLLRSSDHAFVSRMLSYELHGDEAILLPDRCLIKEALIGDGGGTLRLIPRLPPRSEVERAWRSALSNTFPGGMPPNVVPSEPRDLVIGSCGTAACIGTYQRANVKGEHLVAYTLGCTSITFEPCLGHWVLTAPLRRPPRRSYREDKEKVQSRWEAPQLLYVCLDGDPSGRWLAVLGEDPAPSAVEVFVTRPKDSSLLRFATIGTSLITQPGPLSVELIFELLAMLTDFGSATWRTFVDQSFTDNRGPRGLSVGTVSQRIFEVMADACQIACVNRAMHAGIVAWMSSWPSGLRQALQVHHPGGSSVSLATIMLLARLARRGPGNLLTVTKDPAFSERKWGAALEQIDLVHIIPGGQDVDNLWSFRHSQIGPAFFDFARFLFSGIEASWVERSESLRYSECMLGRDSTENLMAHEERTRFLQVAWWRPEPLRGRTLLLCDGSSGRLCTFDGEDLFGGRLSAALTRLRTQLSGVLPGLGSQHINLDEVHAGWRVSGEKGGHWRTCLEHSFWGRRRNCIRCKMRDTRGWESLAATCTFVIAIDLPEVGRHDFQIEILAPVVPFVVLSTDRKIGKLLSATQRMRIQTCLESRNIPSNSNTF